jgi:hypothetical protein
MTEDRTYGLSNKTMGAAWIAAAIGTAGLAVEVLGDDEISGGVKFWILVPFLALIIFLLFWLRRMSTTVTARHIRIRTVGRGRAFAWSDVQAIAVEANPGMIAQSDAPSEVVVLYDSRGRRHSLPAMNEKNLAGIHRRLDKELEYLTRAWLAGRGDDWAEVPAVQARAAERARYRFASWVVGFAWAIMALPITMVVALVGIIAEPPAPWPLYLLFEPMAILVVPLLAFGVGTALSVYRRRQDQAPMNPGG